MHRKLTLQEARRYILAKQGLLNKHRFSDKKGVIDFVEQAGCLQFDPIDICGRNADLVLFSRVENYDKGMLESLLYEDRALVDQWDKNMSIYSVRDWDKMAPIRRKNAGDYEAHLEELHIPLIESVVKTLKQQPYLSASQLEIEGEAAFYTWRHRKLGNAIMDYLFFKGESVIHHREGVKRFFTHHSILDRNKIEKNNHADDEDFKMFMIERRIGALGLIGDGPSDAYLGIYQFKAEQRKTLFQKLVNDGRIVAYEIEGLKGLFYGLKADEHNLGNEMLEKRLEFIAPLDSFMWDRKLIKKLFDFDYKWEIYTPDHQRRYAAYVLPVLYGDELIARIEMAVDRKQRILHVRKLWFEKEMPEDNFMNKLKDRLKQFAQFNACEDVDQSKLKITLHAK